MTAFPLDDPFAAIGPLVNGNGHTDEITLSGVVPRRRRWLVAGLIPLSAYTLLFGHNTIGKSSLAAYYMAGITKGLFPGHYEGQPRNVVVHSHGEDDLESDWRLRFEALGADMDLVTFVEDPITDTDRWAERVTRLGTALIYLDQVEDSLGDTDAGSPRSTRQTYNLFRRKVLKIYGTSVVFSIHANKLNTGDLRARFSGNSAHYDVSRQRFWGMPDQLDPKSGWRWAAPVDANADDADNSVIAYRAEWRQVQTPEGPVPVRVVVETKRIGVTGREAADMFIASEKTKKSTATGRDEIRQLFIEVHADGQRHFSGQVRDAIAHHLGEDLADERARRNFEKRIKLAIDGLPVERGRMVPPGMKGAPPMSFTRLTPSITLSEPQERLPGKDFE